jgi:hypothetical protein
MLQTEEANGRLRVGSDLQTAWKPFFDFWTEAAAATGEQAEALLDGLIGARDPAVVRRLWLRGLTRSLDAFLRTPMFLTLLGRQFDALTLAKNYTDQVATAWARLAGVPRLPDVNGLFERLKIGQDAILDRLIKIEGQMRTRPAPVAQGAQAAESGLSPQDAEEIRQAWQECEEARGDWSKSR